MSRTYDRDAKHYDFALLTHLVETGQGSFFEGPGIYVIKTEDGTVAVRPHQVIFTATPAPFDIVVSERYQPVTNDQVAEALADQPDLGDAVVEHVGTIAPAETNAPRNGWYSASEADDLLRHFLR